MKRIILLLTMTAVFASCEFNQTEKAELPEVDVDVDAEEGNMPEFEVNWADVNVGTTTKMVEVPKVVIVTEEEEIEVPTIDVDMPDDDREKMKRNLIVQAEVTGTEHDLEIQEIRATNNRLYVISTLEATDRKIGNKTMRVQDQVELNAPDLDVKYVIVGERPDRDFNSQYLYLDSMNDFSADIDDAEVIYKR